MTFAIRFSPDAVDHLRRLSARDWARVTRAIATMLVHEPTPVSRNRKPMRTNPVATWELRVGVAVDDADLESMALAEDPRFQALIERSMRHYHEQGGLTLVEVERELGIDHP